MKRAQFILSLAVFFFVLGCGSGSIKKGDTYEVIEDIREDATVEWAQPYSQGFTAVIPKGALLRVKYTPSSASPVFDVEIAMLDGRSEKEYIDNAIVPDYVRNREGYQGFYFSVQKSFIGKQIKKTQ